MPKGKAFDGTVSASVNGDSIGGDTVIGEIPINESEIWVVGGVSANLDPFDVFNRNWSTGSTSFEAKLQVRVVERHSSSLEMIRETFNLDKQLVPEDGTSGHVVTVDLQGGKDAGVLVHPSAVNSYLQVVVSSDAYSGGPAEFRSDVSGEASGVLRPV